MATHEHGTMDTSRFRKRLIAGFATFVARHGRRHHRRAGPAGADQRLIGATLIQPPVSALALPVLLAACAGGRGRSTPRFDDVASRAYVHGGPSTLTLYTVISNAGDNRRPHQPDDQRLLERVDLGPGRQLQDILARRRNAATCCSGSRREMLDVVHRLPRAQALSRGRTGPARQSLRWPRLALADCPVRGSAGQCHLLAVDQPDPLPGCRGFQGFPVSYFPQENPGGLRRQGRVCSA